MGAIEVVAADNKKALKEFVELPYRLYRDYPNWAPPLRMEVEKLLDRAKHPYYANAAAELFLAKREGRTVGRVAAILDRNYDKFWSEQAGFFGFFEAENDPEAAAALLTQARDWAFAKGAKFLRGPMNPSTNYECGMLVDGFDSPPMIQMTYNPPYYPALMDGLGMRKSKDLYAYLQHTATLDTDKIGRVSDKALAKHGVRIRPIDTKNFAADVERVWEVYNSAWEKNWGFVPMTREEFEFSAKDMKQILKPELVLIGEKEGRTIGFALALPDINEALIHTNGSLFPTGLVKILYYQRLIKNVRVVALGVVEEYRATGVAAGFYAALWRNAKRLGYGPCEMSWILEDNVLMNRSAVAMGAKRYKTYRIYEWN